MKLIHRLEDDIEGHTQQEGESASQQVEQIEQHSQPGEEEHGWRRRLNGLSHFWTKINNDWIFNLSAMLAYNFLTSIFPILLFLISVGGFVLAFASPDAQHNLKLAIQGIFPSSLGQTIVTGALSTLAHSAGLMLIITLATALWSGSQLFVNIANTFNIIFRLRPRDNFHKYRMAISMMLLYTVLVPFVFLGSSLSAAAVGLIFGKGSAGLVGFLVQAITLAVSLLVAVALFGAIYVVVPNKPVNWREVWKGALVAAALLVLYELVFPLYENYLLKPNNYGSLAGFAIVILAFFYYLGFILLLGAEVNSWELGQRAMASDIAGLVHSVQAYNTTRGAAGPTAGMPKEDLQTHQGSKAMENNTAAIYHERVQEKRKGNQPPPKFSEATTSNPEKTAEAAEKTTGYNKNRPQHQPSPNTAEGLEANAAGRGQGHGRGGSQPSPAQQSAGQQSAGQQSAGQQSAGQQSAERASSDGRGVQRQESASSSRRGRLANHGEHHREHHERNSNGEFAAMTSEMTSGMTSEMRPRGPGDGNARQIDPTHPSYAAPLPPEARDLPHSGPEQPHKNRAAQVITILATAALPVVMWLLGRNRRPA